MNPSHLRLAVPRPELPPRQDSITSPSPSPLPSPQPLASTSGTSPYYTLPPPSPLLAPPAFPKRKASLANLISKVRSTSLRSSGSSKKSTGVPGPGERNSTSSSFRPHSPATTESSRTSSRNDRYDSYSSTTTQSTGFSSHLGCPASPESSYSAYLGAATARSARAPTRGQPLDDEQQMYNSFGDLLLGKKEDEQPIEWSSDRCFCGKAAEADSIYCSTKCGREDAMRALCGDSEPSSPALPAFPLSTEMALSASSSTNRSSGSTTPGGAETHYRRIEMEEARKERERSAARRAERLAANGGRASKTRQAKVGNWGGVEGEMGRSSKGSSRKASASGRSTHSSVPSLSASSTTSSAVASPVSPTFPQSSFLSAYRPASPHPTLRPSSSSSAEEDLLASYMTSAHQQTTPKQASRKIPCSPIDSDRTPPAHFLAAYADDDVAEGSLLSYAKGLSQDERVGMGYMEFMAREEEADRLAELGVGMGEGAVPRVRNGVQKHTRGKLSFDDVLSVMGA